VHHVKLLGLPVFANNYLVRFSRNI